MRNYYLLLFFIIFISSCKNDIKETNSDFIKNKEKSLEKTAEEKQNTNPKNEGQKPELEKEKFVKIVEEKKKSTSETNINFKEIKGNGIVNDIRYATKNNFTKKQIYKCGRCYLRPEAADKIQEVHQDLQQKYGFGLKMFDCYRPKPAQQRLWDVVPNPDYVTPPSKGSMHNRGLAVDLTIVDKNGNELDMGTPYDFFGKEAHTDNLSLPKHVLENRKILNDAMTAKGFQGIRTEWWHFSYHASAPLASWEWDCL